MLQMTADDQRNVKPIPGNDKCADCGMISPQWASLSFGILICLECSGRHRSLGVHISFVRSITMDSWTDNQIAIMKNGGNTSCANYLLERGPSTFIKPKYESEHAQLYKEVLKARVAGLPEPRSLPLSAIVPGKNFERLEGETEEQYVSRQLRLRQDEAKARMRAKFGSAGLGGGNNLMVGIGSDPSYNPTQGYKYSSIVLIILFLLFFAFIIIQLNLFQRTDE